MEKTLPLYLGPSVIGSAVCLSDGEKITLAAKTYAFIDGICRAYVYGTEGKLLIGVLAPEGSAFYAEKTLSASALSSHRLSFDSITYACAQYSSPQDDETQIPWQKIENIPELLCRDNIVLSLAKSTGTLTDSNVSPTKLAIPLVSDRPFPRPDILCLLTPREINEKLYGVLCISESGAPRRM